MLAHKGVGPFKEVYPKKKPIKPIPIKKAEDNQVANFNSFPTFL